MTSSCSWYTQVCLPVQEITIFWQMYPRRIKPRESDKDTGRAIFRKKSLHMYVLCLFSRLILVAALPDLPDSFLASN